MIAEVAGFGGFAGRGRDSVCVLESWGDSRCVCSLIRFSWKESRVVRRYLGEAFGFVERLFFFRFRFWRGFRFWFEGLEERFFRVFFKVIYWALGFTYREVFGISWGGRFSVEFIS